MTRRPDTTECKHPSTRSVWRTLPDGSEVEFARFCHGCGARLGMGPAAETFNVLTEIRAAELKLTGVAWSDAENDGYLDVGPDDWHGDISGWYAGQLARAIVDHEDDPDDQTITTGADHIGLTRRQVSERQAEADRVEDALARLIDTECAAANAAADAKERAIDEHGYGGKEPAGETANALWNGTVRHVTGHPAPEIEAEIDALVYETERAADPDPRDEDLGGEA
jgi:diadenosine tetraphosphatase ApaH/serine/threonine PP2A family protein phosphatase